MPYYPPASSGSAVTVKEVDGAPSVTPVTEIKVSNGTLTDNTGGSVSIATGASGAGTITTVKDEGSTLSSAVTDIDFVGAGVTATGTTSVTVTIPGGGSSAFAAAVKAFYLQTATNGTSNVATITAAASGDRIVVVTSSRGRDVATPTCTNTTFTEVLAANFSTTIYLSVYIGVVAGGSSGTTVTTTAVGSNWIIQDIYTIGDALTPTAGTPATVTNTSAAAVAKTLIGPITCSVGDFFVFAVTDDDGTTNITQVTASSPVFQGPVGSSGIALMSGIGRAGGTSVSGWFLGGTAGSDFAGGIVSIT